MDIATLEGNLYGFYVMNLAFTLPYHDYTMTYEIKNEDSFQTFMPTFAVMEYENRVEFSIPAEYSTSYIRIKAVQNLVQPGSPCASVNPCDCNSCLDIS